MFKFPALIVVVSTSRVFAQDNFEIWSERCEDFNSLLSQEERDFCTGFNYFRQNNQAKEVSCPSSWPTITATPGDVLLGFPVLTGTGGNVLGTVPEADILMVAPDTPEMLSSPSSIGDFSGAGMDGALSR